MVPLIKRCVLHATLFGAALVSAACIQRVDIEFADETTFSWMWQLQREPAQVVCSDNLVPRQRPPATAIVDAKTAVDVVATFNDCPVIEMFIAYPLQAQIGEFIDVKSRVRDDGQPTRLAYRWREASAVFGRHAQARYRCSQPGPHTLTLNTSDGACETTESVVVNCVFGQP